MHCWTGASLWRTRSARFTCARPSRYPPAPAVWRCGPRASDPTAVIDRGCETPSRWCGWAGGARQRFVVRDGEATPGFLPGMEPGRWHVVLGLHHLPADGMQVRLEVETDSSAPVETAALTPVTPTVRGSSRTVPAGAGSTWSAGDFHAHTVHSDSQESIDQLAARAVTSELDFLAVTDHNTVSHHRLLGASAAWHGVTLVPGAEAHQCSWPRRCLRRHRLGGLPPAGAALGGRGRSARWVALGEQVPAPCSSMRTAGDGGSWVSRCGSVGTGAGGRTTCRTRCAGLPAICR